MISLSRPQVGDLQISTAARAAKWHAALRFFQDIQDVVNTEARDPRQLICARTRVPSPRLPSIAPVSEPVRMGHSGGWH